MTEHSFVSFAFPSPLRLPEMLEAFSAKPSLLGPKTSLVRLNPDGSRVYYYNFGALTFLNASRTTIDQELARIAEFHAMSRDNSPNEEFQVRELDEHKPKAEFSHMVLDRLTDERAEVIAITVAQSVSMEYFERLTDTVSSKVTRLVEGLRSSGNITPSPRTLHPIIAEAITIRSSVVAVLHLLDRPDLVWNDREMDAIYPDLRAVFDLTERFQAISYKIQLIQDSLELLIDMSRDRRLFIAELSIVLLIVFEIIMSFIRS
jgi:uncharacterized Rmd1/YagE family protein